MTKYFFVIRFWFLVFRFDEKQETVYKKRNTKLFGKIYVLD